MVLYLTAIFACGLAAVCFGALLGFTATLTASAMPTDLILSVKVAPSFVCPDVTAKLHASEVECIPGGSRRAGSGTSRGGGGFSSGGRGGGGGSGGRGLLAPDCNGALRSLGKHRCVSRFAIVFLGFYAVSRLQCSLYIGVKCHV